MAKIQDGTCLHGASTDQRLLQNLASYLSLKGYSEEDYPKDDPVLKVKTPEDIKAAFSYLRKVQEPSRLARFYDVLMEGEDVISTTPGEKPTSDEWRPIEEVRWTPIRGQWVISGVTAIIFTPVDVFTVTTVDVPMARTHRFFYGIQSIISREPAQYFLANVSNMTARKRVWNFRALGDHSIASNLPIALGPSSAFSARNKKAFMELNPLPITDPIPECQWDFHDFILQVCKDSMIEFRKRFYILGPENIVRPVSIPTPTVTPAPAPDPVAKGTARKKVAKKKVARKIVPTPIPESESVRQAEMGSLEYWTDSTVTAGNIIVDTNSASSMSTPNPPTPPPPVPFETGAERAARQRLILERMAGIRTETSDTAQ